MTTKADAARFRNAHLDRLVLGGALSEDSLRNFPLNEPPDPALFRVPMLWQLDPTDAHGHATGRAAN